MSYVINTMTNLASQTGFAFLKPGNSHNGSCSTDLFILSDRQTI